MLRFLLLQLTLLAPATAPADAPKPVTASQAAELYAEQTLAAPPADANKRYRLFSPATIKQGETYPLVIYLHGAGSKGDDNRKPLNETVPRLLANPAYREKFPCFVLVPQCRLGTQADGYPYNWVRWEGMVSKKPVEWRSAGREPTSQLSGALAAIDELIKVQPIDQSRVYLTGTSMGGAGSWYLIGHQPERFAAMIAVCGLSDVTRVNNMTGVPVWTFHGEKDDQVPVQRTRDMVQALKQAGGTPKYTEFPGGGHGIDRRVWDEEKFGWLFAQRKPAAKKTEPNLR